MGWECPTKAKEGFDVRFGSTHKKDLIPLATLLRAAGLTSLDAASDKEPTESMRCVPPYTPVRAFARSLAPSLPLSDSRG